jgi:hypothetical protein
MDTAHTSTAHAGGTPIALARREVAARRVRELLRVLHAQNGNRRVQRMVDFHGRRGILEVKNLVGALEAVLGRVARREEGELAPGLASGKTYDKVRRVIRRREREEFALELGASLAPAEQWEEDRRSEAGGSPPVSPREVARDLARPPEEPVEAPGRKDVWGQLDAIDNWMNAHMTPLELEPAGDLMADTGDLAAGTGDLAADTGGLMADAGAAGAELGMDAFALSEAAYLGGIYCKHRFQTVLDSGLLPGGPSYFDAIPDLVRLRKAALEEFVAADQALRAILLAGRADALWGKLYEATGEVFGVRAAGAP